METSIRKDAGASILFTCAPNGMNKNYASVSRNDISCSFLMVYITAVIQLLSERQTCITNSIWTREQRHPHLRLSMSDVFILAVTIQMRHERT